MTPNLRNIRLWVDALRSGEFQQGQGRLHHSGKYCCLGVACELAVRAGVPVERVVEQDPLGEVSLEREVVAGDIIFDDNWLDLPFAVIEWLGFERGDADPDVVIGEGEDEETVSLVTLNDTHEWTFDQIAAAIEATYLLGKEGESHGDASA